MYLTKNQATPTTPTYIVTADSCDPLKVHIEVQGDYHQAMFYAKVLRRAFRQVEVTSADTGEVMMSHYESDEIFNPSVPYHIALMELELTVEKQKTR